MPFVMRKVQDLVRCRRWAAVEATRGRLGVAYFWAVPYDEMAGGVVGRMQPYKKASWCRVLEWLG
jgi:hypothetical protein